jgi:hypothetical protein
MSKGVSKYILLMVGQGNLQDLASSFQMLFAEILHTLFKITFIFAFVGVPQQPRLCCGCRVGLCGSDTNKRSLGIEAF